LPGDTYYGRWSYDDGGLPYVWNPIGGAVSATTLAGFQANHILVNQSPTYALSFFDEGLFGAAGVNGHGYGVIGMTANEVAGDPFGFFGDIGLQGFNSGGVLPSNDEPKRLIAPLFVGEGQGSVTARYQVLGGSRMIFQWDNMNPLFGGSFTFQADLRSNQAIFYYNTIAIAPGDENRVITVGMQNKDKDKGVIITNRLGDLQSGTALHLTRGFDWLNPSGGTNTSVTVQFPRGDVPDELNGTLSSNSGKSVPVKAIVSEDTDGDGMPDVWEMENELDMNINDARGDFDEDELTNLEEYRLGTRPNSKDSDGDVLLDRYEVDNFSLDPMQGFHPLIATDVNADHDGDGISTIDELTFGTNPLGDDDLDGDGVNDAVEIVQGSLPNDPSDNGQAPPAANPDQGLKVGDQIRQCGQI